MTMAVATQTAARTKLPTIVENPDADILIYDGDCRFCSGQVQRLARLDGTGKRLAFISLHDPEVTRRWPDLTHEMLMEQMYLVDPQGNRYGGAAAFRYLTRRLPWLWILAPLMHIPFSLPVWQWMYRLVARHRYKLMGKTQTCDSDACAVHLK
jgi:predicted DCC family thiol-disulfide oxidoreductase YuxK